MSFDELGDRMKAYEAFYTSETIPKDSIVYIRVDGRSFSNYTSKYQKPFDPIIQEAMRNTARDLLKETNAKIAYTQSDEISLILFNDNPEAQPYFGYKIHKLTSVVASYATAAFIQYMKELTYRPIFDCRVCTLPSKTEATNMILWRCQDAARNAVTSAARCIYSHNQLQNVSTKQMLEMMPNYETKYTAEQKYGSFVQKRVQEYYLSYEEMMDIPIKYRPHTNMVVRSIPRHLNGFDFRKASNKKHIIFNGDDPVIYENC